MTINEMIREMKAKGHTYKVISMMCEKEVIKKYNNAYCTFLSPQRLGVIAKMQKQPKTDLDFIWAIKKTYGRLCK